MKKFKIVESQEFRFASECPPGTFAGAVEVWDAAKPPTICLYRERGNQYIVHREFWQSLWDRGYRYFRYAHRGRLFEIVEHTET